MATSTPWGTAQHSERITRGIVAYSCARHGGLHVAPTLNQKIHPAWRRAKGWYEEDVEYMIVAFTFPEHFPSLKDVDVRSTLKQYRPDAYMTVTGETLTEADSWILATRALRAKHANDYIAVAAWGSYEPAVPAGKVGVLAVRGGRSENHAYASEDRRYFLVPEDCYAERRKVLGYIVDPATDLPWEGPNR